MANSPNKWRIILVLKFFLFSCFPSMQIGPNPHSIEFKKSEFNGVITYLNAHPEIQHWDIEKSENDISESILSEVENLGFLNYQNYGNYKLLYCGYGVVGKGWGFLFSSLSIEDLRNLIELKEEKSNLNITYLEHLEGNWYRFGES